MKCNYCNGEYSVGHRYKQMLFCYVQDMSEINRLIEKLLSLGGSKEKIMSKFKEYLEAAYDGKGISMDIDELLEKNLHNLDRYELLGMVGMYVKDVDDDEMDSLENDSDDDEIIDFLISSLTKKQKELLVEKQYKKSFKKK